jgi:hypothetical protein
MGDARTHSPPPDPMMVDKIIAKRLGLMPPA